MYWISVLYLFFGLLLFVPGILVLLHESKKPVKQQQDGIILIAYVLICLGVMISLGLGGKVLFE